jgi:hypothetical protein
MSTQFTKFEPITVRAAARILFLRRCEWLSAGETRGCLRGLAEMDRFSPGRVARARALRRLARRRFSTGAVPAVAHEARWCGWRPGARPRRFTAHLRRRESTLVPAAIDLPQMTSTAATVPTHALAG